jgi:hypothetical protein
MPSSAATLATAGSGLRPSARRAADGIPRPSANASNIEEAVGLRL